MYEERRTQNEERDVEPGTANGEQGAEDGDRGTGTCRGAWRPAVRFPVVRRADPVDVYVDHPGIDRPVIDRWVVDRSSVDRSDVRSLFVVPGSPFRSSFLVLLL
jgi:hypothetical protein